MRLAQFILANVEHILAEWEAFASTLAPGATMTKLALRDDAEAILLATARDMQVDQSLAQQECKSKGNGGASTTETDRLDNASARHAGERVGSGFDINEVVSEYPRPARQRPAPLAQEHSAARPRRHQRHHPL